MKAEDIKNVGVVATGVIGCGWATNFAMKGLNVAVYDISQEQLDGAKAFVEKNLAHLQEKGLLTAEEKEAALSRVRYSTDPTILADVQFIQESGPENYEIKDKIRQTVEENCPADAVIASSTSGLSITKMAETAIHPERMIVGHPYNPPYLIPLVDVCKGEYTSDEAAQTAYDFYKGIGKVPVLLHKEALGFIANRLQMALWREAVEMIHRGICSLEDIDKAVVFGPGIRWALMGPAMCFHLSGGSGGLEGLLHHLEPGWNVWLKDMADWKDFPYPDWPHDAQVGIEEEIANRAPEFGNTEEDIISWRDDRLIEILKMHHMI